MRLPFDFREENTGTLEENARHEILTASAPKGIGKLEVFFILWNSQGYGRVVQLSYLNECSSRDWKALQNLY